MNSTPTASPLEDAPDGIRTELVVGSPDGCPVARASASIEGPVCSVSRSCGGDGATVGEFEVQRRDDVLADDRTCDDALAEDAIADGGARTDPATDVVDRNLPECDLVFETETSAVYRFDDAHCERCPCETVESLGVPIASVAAKHGRLHLTFHAEDAATVRAVVDALREHHADVSVRQLHHAGDGPSERPVLVDRNKLTTRQLEVLETAWRLGYFEDPRGATGGEVATALGISGSTFAEHLAAAQRKIFGDVLDCAGI